MPIFHDVAQYSEEYDRLKIGIPTSSNFHKIVTPQGKPSKQWREYACVLIAERILQQRIEFYNSPAMERGLIVETGGRLVRIRLRLSRSEDRVHHRRRAHDGVQSRSPRRR